MIFFAKVFTRRGDVHQQRQLVPDCIPVVIVQLDTHVLGDGIQVDWRIRRSSNSSAAGNGILERLACQDIGRFDILSDHIDDPVSGLVGAGTSFAVWRGDGSTAWKGHSKSLAQGVHGRCGSHGVAVADTVISHLVVTAASIIQASSPRCRERDRLHELRFVDLAFGE